MGSPVARFLSRWPLGALVRRLAPTLDRLARWWLLAKREALPDLEDATPSVVSDVLDHGAAADRERMFAFLTDWYGRHPAELERFVVAVAEPLARDESGRPLERLLDRVLAVASPELKQKLYGWVEDHAEWDEHAVAYAERVFDWIRRSIERHKGPLRGLRVLELGPGHMLVTGVLFYVHGAQSYTAIDYFPIAGKASSIYERLRRHLADRPRLAPIPADVHAEALRRFDEVVKLDGPEAVFDESKVGCRYPVDAAKLPFGDGSFDVIFSIASFEHFTDPVAAVRECTRVLAPGGIGLHQIDLRDHRDFTKPLDFLRYDEDEWRGLHKDLFCFTNRFRKSDFERAFAESGLVVKDADVTLKAPLDPGVRAQLHPRFRERSQEDLEAVSVFFALGKPGAAAALLAP